MFDRYLAREATGVARRAALAAASLGLHAIAIAALLGATLFWKIEELDPPPLTLTLFAASSQILQPPTAGAPIQGRIDRPRKARARFNLPTWLEPVTPPAPRPSLASQHLEPDPPANPEALASDEGGQTTEPVPRAIQFGEGGSEAGERLDSQRLLYPDPHLPDDFKERHANETVVATYRLCIRTDGRIASVAPLKGVAEIDPVVARQVKNGWLYKRQPFPICVARQFIFLIR